MATHVLDCAAALCHRLAVNSGPFRRHQMTFLKIIITVLHCRTACWPVCIRPTSWHRDIVSSMNPWSILQYRIIDIITPCKQVVFRCRHCTKVTVKHCTKVTVKHCHQRCLGHVNAMCDKFDFNRLYTFWKSVTSWKPVHRFFGYHLTSLVTVLRGRTIQ